MDIRQFIATQIKTLRKGQLHISAQKLGGMLKPKRSGKTISSWETGRTRPDAEALLQLSKLFNVEISTFFPPEFSKRKVTSRDKPQASLPTVEAIVNNDAQTIIDINKTYPVPVLIAEKYGKAFFLKVADESMNKVLPQGIYALVDPTQSCLENGNVFAVKQADNTVMIKRVKVLGENIELMPDSDEEAFTSETFCKEEFESGNLTVIGRVVWAAFPEGWQI
jgi:repressor LexA